MKTMTQPMIETNDEQTREYPEFQRLIKQFIREAKAIDARMNELKDTS